MAKNQKDIEERNKAQRDGTRKRGGWKDERQAARRNKSQRRDFFQKANDDA